MTVLLTSLAPYVERLLGLLAPIDAIHVVLAVSAILASLGVTFVPEVNRRINPVVPLIVQAVTVVLPVVALPAAAILGYVNADPMYVISYVLALGVAYHYTGNHLR